MWMASSARSVIRCRAFRTIASAVLFIACASTAASAADVQATIEFDIESLPAGTILDSVSADAGGGDLIGPIGVHGTLPSNPVPNSAVIFDSGMRTGGDSDLGTPNEDFGGPGVGADGGLGEPYQNDTAQWNILIVAEDLVDANNDDLVDDPDDGTENGMLLEFDFTTITEPFVPEDVTLYQITHIDTDGPNPGEVRLYDAAGTLLSTTLLVALGENGILTQDLGTPGVGVSGVARMEVEINDSAAIDDIVFEISSGPGPSCGTTAGGPIVGEVGELFTFDVTGTTTLPGESVVIDVTGTTGPTVLPPGLPAGATMTPPLPLDSAPAQSATSTFEWIPQAGDEGNYEITFSVVDSIGQLSECSVLLEVTCDLSIDIQPMDATVCEGGDTSFFVTGDWTEPVEFEWRRDGVPIPGATGATLPLTGVLPGDAGSYEVAITNPCGTLVSDAAVLTVQLAPTIDLSPADQNVCAGGTAVFSVTASGEGPLEYQWRIDGAPIPGETSDTLTLLDVDETDEGAYDVVVTNACGSATSDAAQLTILAPPSVLVMPTELTACTGKIANFTADIVGGDPPLAIQWDLDGTPIPGAESASLDIPSVSLADQGVYTVTVTNDCGVDMASATLTVLVSPLVIADPQGVSVCAGDPVALSVDAEGSEPLGYQWQLDGVDIPGADQASYSIPAASPADAGSYTVIVSNDCGSATSDAAVVEVAEARTIDLQPQPQSACEGGSAVFTVGVSGAGPIEYQWLLDGVEIPGANGSSLVIDPVTPADAGDYSVVVSNDCGSAMSGAAALVVDTAPTVLVDPVGGSICEGAGITLSVNAEGTEPLSFQWQKDGIDIPGAQSASLTFDPAVRADSGSYTVVVSNPCGPTESAPAIVDVANGPSIVTMPPATTICLDDPLVLTVVADGAPPLVYQWQLDGLDIPGAMADTYSVTAAGANDAGTYSVVVTNPCGSVTSGPIEITVVVRPNLDLVGGGAVEECEGASATLEVTVSGTEPIVLQWRKDGIDIPGAHDPQLVLDPLVPSNAGTYTVVATNDCDEVASGPIEVMVLLPPTIELIPTGNNTTCAGESYLFEVMAAGTGLLEYQWLLDGAPIPGANGASYEILEVGPGDYGVYSVLVSNDCGSVESDAAPLAEPLPSSCETPFARCDCNADGLCNIADGIYILRFTYQGFNPPICLAACDHNDDGLIDISDVVFIMEYIFNGGPMPPAPFPECAVDPTPDDLECPIFNVCPQD